MGAFTRFCGKATGQAAVTSHRKRFRGAYTELFIPENLAAGEVQLTSFSTFMFDKWIYDIFSQEFI